MNNKMRDKYIATFVSFMGAILCLLYIWISSKLWPKDFSTIFEWKATKQKAAKFHPKEYVKQSQKPFHRCWKKTHQWVLVGQGFRRIKINNYEFTKLRSAYRKAAKKT